MWDRRVDKITKIKANEVLKCCEVTIVGPPVKQLECFISPAGVREGWAMLSSPGTGGAPEYLQMAFL